VIRSLGAALVTSLSVAAVRPATAAAEGEYTLEIVGADVVAVGAAAIGVGVESRALFFGAMGLYAAGGPIVHLLEEEPAEAGLSLGLRVVGPVAGAWLMTQLSQECRDWLCLGPPITGFALGMVAAMVVDGSVLARTDDASGTPTMPLGWHGQF
jgi:hypothetical protein